MPDTVLAGQVVEGAELRLRTSGAAWQACAEAYADSVMRLRLRPDPLGVLPVLPPGTVVDCSFATPAGQFRAEGAVTRTEGPVVWLIISSARLSTERRRSGRTAGGFSVVFWCQGVCGTGTCTDISPGGMRIHLPVPLTVGMDLELTFQLPGDLTDVTVRGKVIHRSDDTPGSGCYLGVQFGEVSASARTRIALHCRAQPVA